MSITTKGFFLKIPHSHNLILKLIGLIDAKPLPRLRIVLKEHCKRPTSYGLISCWNIFSLNVAHKDIDFSSFLISMNLSGTLNAFKVLRKPQLCLPHMTVPTFDQLPIPLTAKTWPDIKAIVLDKDNCFAVSRGIYVYKPYKVGSLFVFSFETSIRDLEATQLLTVTVCSVDSHSTVGSFQATAGGISRTAALDCQQLGGNGSSCR